MHLFFFRKGAMFSSFSEDNTVFTFSSSPVMDPLRLILKLEKLAKLLLFSFGMSRCNRRGFTRVGALHNLLLLNGEGDAKMSRLSILLFSTE